MIYEPQTFLSLCLVIQFYHYFCGWFFSRAKIAGVKILSSAGGRIEFEAASHCNTFAPEDLGTFYKQRRRWGPSTTANVWELILCQKQARKNNPYISMPYIVYHLMMLIFSQIGVSTTIMMVAEAFSIGIGKKGQNFARGSA